MEQDFRELYLLLNKITQGVDPTHEHFQNLRLAKRKVNEMTNKFIRYYEQKGDICPICDSKDTYRMIGVHCNSCACNSEV